VYHSHPRYQCKGGEKKEKKNFTFINICTQYFILKVVFIHENLTSDMQLMLDLDTINTSDYLYILAYYILFCSMYYKSLLSQIFISHIMVCGCYFCAYFS